MGRYRNVPEPGEPFDHFAISSNPLHLGASVPGGPLLWTCSPRAYSRPFAGKCRESFPVDVLEPVVPAGWQWSEAAGVVSYTCPRHRLPGVDSTNERLPLTRCPGCGADYPGTTSVEEHLAECPGADAVVLRKPSCVGPTDPLHAMTQAPPRHRCGDCGVRYSDDTLPLTLHQVHKLADRLTPGGVVPSGACECGGLVYPS